MFGQFINAYFAAPQGYGLPSQQPLQQQQQYQNTPPASSRSISTLPMVKITVDDLQEECNKECLICLDDQHLGTYACKLPCGHLFHRNCIVTWLEKHANCPFCRYELETNDANYERLRKVHMKDRKIRLRRDELDHKSISQLRELCSSFSVSTHGCVDKTDMVDRLIASGKVTITEGAPTRDILVDDFHHMSIRELQHLLLSFGLSSQGLLEKNEFKQRLLESGRIQLVNADGSPAVDTDVNYIGGGGDNQISSSDSGAYYNSYPTNGYSDSAANEDTLRSSALASASTVAHTDDTDGDPAVRSLHHSSESSSRASFDELWTMTVDQLQSLCVEHDINSQDCVDKKDFIQRILLSGYLPDVDDVEIEAMLNQRDATNSRGNGHSSGSSSSSSASSSSASLDALEDLSIKDLKNLASRKGVNISGCLEKRDIIDRILQHSAGGSRR